MGAGRTPPSVLTRISRQLPRKQYLPDSMNEACSRLHVENLRGEQLPGNRKHRCGKSAIRLCTIPAESFCMLNATCFIPGHIDFHASPGAPRAHERLFRETVIRPRRRLPSGIRSSPSRIAGRRLQVPRSPDARPFPTRASSSRGICLPPAPGRFRARGPDPGR